ncbi:uncharacterized protein ACHE_31252A [Aspergillus chevalieri]|uniref:NmrA-like domain-containing protein n=1 Tax=Aspergillus chevalieri TaxID=182096 RepID=A0A7R7VMF5_ASPCH|nr:uncharacterized protein ACHE_31252A [Aspergillus chevalieri]BCR87265.1 hypothetical protein ACHE_31252A [Aspergillus chevalieri]
MTIKFGALGPNPMTKQAVFHNGGDIEIGPFTLADIAEAIVRILDPANFADTANQAAYIYSAAVTERKLTVIVSKILGVDFGSVENGSVPYVNIGELMEKAKGQLAAGDISGMLNYYYVMMYEEGYGGKDFRKFSWNERLGIRLMSDDELEKAIREILA